MITGLPKEIHTGEWAEGHIQGIAADLEKGYIYYSFTTVLVKARLDGTVVGYVKGFLGHLGCIDFNDGDGKVYASLELKHDSIGKCIERITGVSISDENAFYIAVIDADGITRAGMDAEKDGIVRTAYLPRVTEWFDAVLPDGRQHKYAVSGIDGTSVGPVFGNGGNENKLMVACGIYGDTARDDNDFNIIMQYDLGALNAASRKASQLEPHHSGVMPEEVYFIYTGNTTWGIQNLEYDAFSGNWFAAVYRGKKEKFRNHPFFVIDGAKPPVPGKVAYGEEGKILHLLNEGTEFPYGSTGMYSCGDGRYLFSHDYRSENGKYGSVIRLYKGDGKGSFELL